MPHPETRKYKISRDELFPGNMPHFTDFNDPRFAHSAGGNNSGNNMKQSWLAYFQWAHCVGNWGEDHSMCKKARWYLERMMFDSWLEKHEEKRALGHYDYTIHYGAAPWRHFVAHYQPVKKNRPGLYEFWKDRDFQPVLDVQEAGDWRIHAPILHDIFVKGKKPIYDEAEE
jgi:cytochrome c oxidase subunit 6b